MRSRAGWRAARYAAKSASRSSRASRLNRDPRPVRSAMACTRISLPVRSLTRDGRAGCRNVIAASPVLDDLGAAAGPDRRERAELLVGGVGALGLELARASLLPRPGGSTHGGGNGSRARPLDWPGLGGRAAGAGLGQAAAGEAARSALLPRPRRRRPPACDGPGGRRRPMPPRDAVPRGRSSGTTRVAAPRASSVAERASVPTEASSPARSSSDVGAADLGGPQAQQAAAARRRGSGSRARATRSARLQGGEVVPHDGARVHLLGAGHRTDLVDAGVARRARSAAASSSRVRRSVAARAERRDLLPRVARSPVRRWRRPVEGDLRASAPRLNVVARSSARVAMTPILARMT